MFSWDLVCGSRPAVMGIVNVTPDSFSDAGRFLDPDAAIGHGLALVADGADLLDVGGESTRPGASPVEAAEQIRRVVPVVAALAAQGGVPVSVDTQSAVVAAAAVDAGATIVNDVSAGREDPGMFELVAGAGVGYVAMHMQGRPRTMQDAPAYRDVVADVGDFLVNRLEAARAAGIGPGALCADPGIGFGKLSEHNLELLARLREIVSRVEVPVLVGTSRKSFLASVVAPDAEPRALAPEARDDATLATVVWALEQGAAVVRVHDARPSAESVRLLETMHAIDAEAVA